MLTGISVMVGVRDWLGDETDATLEEPAKTPEGCPDGDELDWLWGGFDADGAVVSLPTSVPNVKSLENEVDVVDEFVLFVVRGLCEARPAVEDEGAVANDDSDVAVEGRVTGGEDFGDGVVVGLDIMDAAPGPLPTAGTEPICLELAAMDGPPSVEDKATVSKGFDVVDEGRAADGEGVENDVVVALDSMDAAPAPLPTAGTEPTCFEGRMLETEAACATGREFASTEEVDEARVGAAAAELSLVESGRCPTAAADMAD